MNAQKNKCAFSVGMSPGVEIICFLLVHTISDQGELPSPNSCIVEVVSLQLFWFWISLLCLRTEDWNLLLLGGAIAIRWERNLVFLSYCLYHVMLWGSVFNTNRFAFLHLQLEVFSTSASPRVRACVTRPSPLIGKVWVLVQNYLP